MYIQYFVPQFIGPYVPKMMFAIFTDSITDLNVASRTVVQNGASMDQASVIFLVVPIKNEK